MSTKRINYEFNDKELFKTSLTHSSYANEEDLESNERLEFLGDAVLGVVVADILYDKFPNEPEGVLSKMRSSIVSRPTTAKFALELGIDEKMLLGKGEEQTGGRDRISNLGGAFEAVIGAIYIDGGFKEASNFIKGVVLEYLDNEAEFIDYKTELQELAQKKFRRIPKYKVLDEEGPPHEKTFIVEVRIGKRILGKGSGRNKKIAEQAAAKEVFINYPDFEESTAE